MKTITFYSYKGGVGRTLALCNVANRLSEFGKKVCIIDFDLEAPGVHLKFESNVGFHGVKNGLVDYIYEFATSSKVAPDIREYVTKINFDHTGFRSDIDLIAAGDTLKKDYWRKLSAINWNHFFYDENSVGIDFFLNLKEQIRSQLRPDFLLIDSRTGITDISGVTMSIFADEVVLLAANNKENLEGIGQVIKTLAVPANSIQNKVPKINFVLCRIPYFFNAKDKPRETNAKNSALKALNSVLFEAGIDDLSIEKSLVIHSDPDLEMQERFKMSYDHERTTEINKIPIGLDYLELFEEITRDVISNDERSVFNDFLKAEFLIERAIANPDPLERINGLKAALNINPKSTVACYELASAYFDIKQYDKSMEYIEESIKINPKGDPSIYGLKGSVYFAQKEFEKAKGALSTALTIEPKNYFSRIALGAIYYRLGELSEALVVQKDNIQLFADIDSPWNDYANTLRAAGRTDEALDAVYHALEINPQSAFATGTLAEIHASLNNLREFYKNLELSFSFGMSSKNFQQIIEMENIYRQFANDEKFKMILDKYNIVVDLSVLSDN